MAYNPPPLTVLKGGTHLTTFGTDGFLQSASDVISTITIPLPVNKGGTASTTKGKQNSAAMAMIFGS